MKTRILHMSVFFFIFLGLFSGCEKEDHGVKGMFVGPYCNGYIIKILSQSDIEYSWKSGYCPENFENSVVARFDTTLINLFPNSEIRLMKDSIFYFKYRIGGSEPALEHCGPNASITIVALSKYPF